MPTGQAVISAALTTLGILEQGGTPNASDSNDALSVLNDMWQAWGIDDGLVNAIVHNRYPLTYSASSYTLGPSNAASFNGPIPSKIYEAYFVNTNGGLIAGSSLGDAGSGYAISDTFIVVNGSGIPATGHVTGIGSNGVVTTYVIDTPGTGFIPQPGYSTQAGGGQPGVGSGLTINVTSSPPEGQNRNLLNLVSSKQYYSHRDLTALALTPDELYVDFNLTVDGFIRCYLWPILSIGPASLELVAGTIFKTWTLAGNYFLPPGYGDLIRWALAYRLSPSYGSVVQQTVLEIVTQQAEKAELRVREMNKMNRQMEPGTEFLQEPQQQPAK